MKNLFLKFIFFNTLLNFSFYTCIQIENNFIECLFLVFQFGSEGPHYEEYKSYIEFEKSQKEPSPSRIQSIFERAIVENCLKEDLWLDYIKYMVSLNFMLEIVKLILQFSYHYHCYYYLYKF